MRPVQKTLSVVTLAFAMLVLAPWAQADKIRIAVLDFNTEAVHGTWRYGWSYNNLATTAADNLTHELVQTGQFSVIERNKLESILREQDLASSGAVDASTAARMGKVLGVQMVVIGSVLEFGINEKGGKIPQVGKWKWGRGIGASVVTGKAKLSARLVDTTTAEILGSFEGSGAHRFGKGEFAGARAGQNWDTGMASKILSEAVQSIAGSLQGQAVNLEPSTYRGGIEGKIARVDGGKIYLSVGAASGVRVGDMFVVRSLGEAILDPDTGEELGREEGERGRVKITKIVGDKLSIAEAESGSGFAVGDKVLMK